jgi:hypothetical protein
MDKMKQSWLIFMLIPLVVVIMMLSSCSKKEDQIMCYPTNATGCIGWAGNK